MFGSGKISNINLGNLRKVFGKFPLKANFETLFVLFSRYIYICIYD
jgi:hypothetical protein